MKIVTWEREANADKLIARFGIVGARSRVLGCIERSRSHTVLDRLHALDAQLIMRGF